MVYLFLLLLLLFIDCNTCKTFVYGLKNVLISCLFKILAVLSKIHFVHSYFVNLCYWVRLEYFCCCVNLLTSLILKPFWCRVVFKFRSSFFVKIAINTNTADFRTLPNKVTFKCNKEMKKCNKLQDVQFKTTYQCLLLLQQQA